MRTSLSTLAISALISSLMMVLAASSPVEACHLEENLRQLGHEFTPEQLKLLSHGGPGEQVEYQPESAFACAKGQADFFPCDNVDMLAVLSLSNIGGGSGNDMWGWEDPATGVEYALVGRSNGTAFVDISDPVNPVYVANLATHSNSSTWRDIKVYADHAFIVADFAGDHGMQVVDLNQLRDITETPQDLVETAHYGDFERAHNIVINEDSGFAYAVGSESCNGGLHMIDIRNPTAPSFAGCFSDDAYTHDAQCITYQGPDGDHQGKEICFASNEDSVTIVDVTNKTLPVMLARVEYVGFGYTHQGWLTEDRERFIHDDELDELNFGHQTRTYIWNVADLDAPFLEMRYTAETSSSDHNQYIRGDVSYQANYTRGLALLDIEDVAAGVVEEIGSFDTFPSNDNSGFSGAWSTYPFFDSGVVLVSDTSRGLFILRPRLVELEVTGSCPGPATIRASNLDPNGSVFLAWSMVERSSSVPAGVCAGTPLAIDNPRPLQPVAADAQGFAELEVVLPEAACGAFLQGIDSGTCMASNLVMIP